jgi:hypothetical protein
VVGGGPPTIGGNSNDGNGNGNGNSNGGAGKPPDLKIPELPKPKGK